MRIAWIIRLVARRLNLIGDAFVVTSGNATTFNKPKWNKSYR